MANETKNDDEVTYWFPGCDYDRVVYESKKTVV